MVNVVSFVVYRQEWLIIVFFIVVFCYEIGYLIQIRYINMSPLSNEYINLMPVEYYAQRKLNSTSFFMLLCWLRLLKFLR